MKDLDKITADKFIKQAYQFLEGAHHLWYKNAGSNEEAQIDDAICDALDALQAIAEEA